MILVPSPGKTDTGHYHDPYTERGARSIIRRFQDDVRAMLRYMLQQEENFESGRAMLAHSPLSRKIWVAGAMKTLGLVEEHETRGGACALTLTKRGHDLYDRLELLDKL